MAGVEKVNEKHHRFTSVHSFYHLLKMNVDMPWRVGPVQCGRYETDESFRARLEMYYVNNPDLFPSIHTLFECEHVCWYVGACTNVAKCWYGHILTSDLLKLADTPTAEGFPVGVGSDFWPLNWSRRKFASQVARGVRSASPPPAPGEVAAVYFDHPGSKYCQLKPRTDAMKPLILPTSFAD